MALKMCLDYIRKWDNNEKSYKRDNVDFRYRTIRMVNA
jgi:hypothetical protein